MTLLAHSALAPHLIWADLLEYQWAILADAFCLFATSHGVTHLAHPPWGENPIEPAITLAFKLLAQVNPAHIPGRIENVDEPTALRLEKAGYQIQQASVDYLYRRDEIVKLSGNRFRAQRAAANQAARLRPSFRPFVEKDIEACLSLFDRWMVNGKADSASLDLMMREDARFAHHCAMRQMTELGLTGRVVEVDGVIAGYTFGFRLSDNTFCVLLEIVDRSMRGLAAWLFREFCGEQTDYEWINTMDSSGLDRLARAKMQWHPIQLIPAYTVTEVLKKPNL